MPFEGRFKGMHPLSALRSGMPVFQRPVALPVFGAATDPPPDSSPTLPPRMGRLLTQYPAEARRVIAEAMAPLLEPYDEPTAARAMERMLLKMAGGGVHKPYPLAGKANGLLYTLPGSPVSDRFKDEAVKILETLPEPYLNYMHEKNIRVVLCRKTDDLAVDGVPQSKTDAFGVFAFPVNRIALAEYRDWDKARDDLARDVENRSADEIKNNLVSLYSLKQDWQSQLQCTFFHELGHAFDHNEGGLAQKWDTVFRKDLDAINHSWAYAMLMGEYVARFRHDPDMLRSETFANTFVELALPESVLEKLGMVMAMRGFSRVFYGFGARIELAMHGSGLLRGSLSDAAALEQKKQQRLHAASPQPGRRRWWHRLLP